MNARILTIAGIVLGVLLIAFVVTRGEKGSSGQVTAEESVAVSPDAQMLFDQAQSLEGNGQRVEAKQTYEKLMMEYPDFDQIEQIQEKITGINMGLLFSNGEYPGCTVTHEIVSGDTLGKLAKQYGTTVALIKRRNDLKNDLIRVGRKLSIWTCEFNIFVDKSQNVLMLKQDDTVLKVYIVSTGIDNNTPVGEFTITTKLVDPVWFKSGAVVPPDSPANELGSRWLGFDIPGYGIHGTIKPELLGQQATAGCVRMSNAEVEELYSMVPSGTKVVVVD